VPHVGALTTKPAGISRLNGDVPVLHGGWMPERGLMYQGDWPLAKLGSMKGGGTKPAGGWKPPSQLKAAE